MPVSATLRSSLRVPDLGTSLHSAGAAPSRILFKSCSAQVASFFFFVFKRVLRWFCAGLVQCETSSDFVITVVCIEEEKNY